MLPFAYALSHHVSSVQYNGLFQAHDEVREISEEYAYSAFNVTTSSLGGNLLGSAERSDVEPTQLLRC